MIHLVERNSDSDGDGLVCTAMGMGMETTCAVTDGDGEEFGWGWSGTDSKFTVTDGDGDNCSSPCSSLMTTPYAWPSVSAWVVQSERLTPASAASWWILSASIRCPARNSQAELFGHAWFNDLIHRALIRAETPTVIPSPLLPSLLFIPSILVAKRFPPNPAGVWGTPT